MSKSKEIEKSINGRSTKQELQDALKEAINVIKGFETFDPKVEALKKEKEKVYNEVKKEPSNNLKDLADQLKTYGLVLENENETYLKAQQDKFNRYKDLNLAIEFKNKELEELYEVERALFNLSAILKAHSEKKIELQEEYKNLENNLREKYNSFKSDIENKIRVETLERETEKDNYKNIKNREIEEYEYEFERKKKKKLDDLNDLIEQKEKVINEKINDLNQRESVIEEKEDHIKELEGKVSNIPNLIKEAEELSYKKGVDKTTKSNEYAKRILETSHKGTIQLLESKIESLIEKLDSANNEIIDLKNKLSESYNKIENMANKSMESTSNSNYMRSLEKLATNNKNENK